MHLKIGTPADYPPFASIDPINQKYSGFEIDLILYIIASLDFECEFIKTSWYDLDCDLNNNKFDMALGGISLTEHRINSFLTSIPIMDDAKTILTSIKHQEEINSLEDIDQAEYTIITNRGGTNERFVKANIKHANVVILDDNTIIFEKIATGEVDFMITDLSEARYREISDSRLLVARPITLYTKLTAYGFIYSKKHQQLKDKIDVALYQFMQSMEYARLYNKYFSK